jgi:hypothetical protein
MAVKGVTFLDFNGLNKDEQATRACSEQLT